MLTREDFKTHLINRHGEEVQKKISSAVVAIAGLGGLGSNVALDLARIGIGKMILIDFDEVDLTNINRQAYFIEHIGQKKVNAMVDLIRRVNPFIELESFSCRVSRDNALDLLSDADIVVEAFDNPQSKAAIAEAILIEGSKPIVTASGMAGFLSSNTIRTRRIRKNFYVCGDGVTDINMVNGLMAPRVHIASSHQSNMVLRLILGQENV